MEREQFDKLIQGKIQVHDEGYERPFDTEKIWVKTGSKNKTKRWYLISAVLVVAVLTYGLFDSLDQNRPARLSKVLGGSKKTDTSLLQRKPAVLLVKVSPTRVINEKPNREKPIKEITKIKMSQKPDTAIRALSAESPAVVQFVAIPATEKPSAVKVFFKRGIQASPPEIKVSLVKGRQMKFDMFKRERLDSSAFVLNSKPKLDIKLHF